MERTLKQKEDHDEEEEEEEEIFYSPDSTEEKNEEIQSNDDEEKKKIDHLREIVEKQDPACKVICCKYTHIHTDTQSFQFLFCDCC